MNPDLVDRKAWKCRFKGILVERDAYLLDLDRYVVLNPVRAGILADAGDWAWSSYPAVPGRQPGGHRDRRSAAICALD